MNRQDRRILSIEVARLRPVATVVLAALAVSPSLVELMDGNLSAVTLLARLAGALVVCGALVWVATAVVLHYADVQVRSREEEQASELRR